MNIVEKYVKENKILTLTLDDLQSINYYFGTEMDEICKDVFELSKKIPIAIKTSHKFYDLVELYNKGRSLGCKLLVKNNSAENELTRGILHNDIPFINHTENHAVIIETASGLEHEGFAVDGSAFVSISMKVNHIAFGRDVKITYINNQLDTPVLAEINTNPIDYSLHNITAAAFCEYILANPKKYTETELISLCMKINHLANWLLNVIKRPDLIARGPYCKVDNGVFFFDIDNLDTFLETFFSEYESGLTVNAIKEWIIDRISWEILTIFEADLPYAYAVVKMNGIYAHFGHDSFICSDLHRKSVLEMDKIYDSKEKKQHHALQICHPSANTYTAIDKNSMYSPIAVATVSEKAKKVCINFSDCRYVMTEQYAKTVRNCLPMKAEIIVPLPEDSPVEDVLEIFLALYISDKTSLGQKFVQNPLEETLLKLWNESIAIL